jgi:hypothetical protein
LKGKISLNICGWACVRFGFARMQI